MHQKFRFTAKKLKKALKGSVVSTLIFLFLITPLAPVFAAEASVPAADSTVPNPVISDISSSAPVETVDSTSTAVDLAAPVSGKGKIKLDTAASMQTMSASSYFVPGGAPGDSSKVADKVRLPQSENLTGALIYDYSIIVPPGRNGLQSDLKLSYSSQAGEEGSIVGYGWSVNIPSIERINRKGTDKLYTENYFNSSLGGELVNIGGTSYSAKVDNGEFLKYEFDGTSWLVTDKQGIKYKFGATAGARQDDAADTAKVFKWMLEEVRDTNDNFVRYEYFKDAGQIYPSKIFYIGSGAVDGIFEVEFLREARTDATVSYRTGFSVKTNYRISEIQTKINSSWVKKYTLVYGLSDNGGRSLLNSIVESGKDEITGVIITLPATSFNYQSNNASSWSLSPSFVPPVFFKEDGRKDVGVRLADINGDGLIDIIKFVRRWTNGASDLLDVYINNSREWVKNTSWIVPANFYFADENGNMEFGEIADVNGDGLPDLLRSDPASGINKVFLNTGNGWTENVSWLLPINLFGDQSDVGVRLADINGDGLMDILQSISWGPIGGAPLNNVYINNGQGWTLDSSWVVPVYLKNGYPNDLNDNGVRLVDVNGDGLTDILKLVKSGTNNSPPAIRDVYLNNGYGWTKDASWLIPDNFYFITSSGYSDYGNIADVNGDGLPDLLRNEVNSAVNEVYINIGKGWVRNTAWVLPAYLISGQEDYGGRLADVNGDGLLDMIEVHINPQGNLPPIKVVHINNIKKPAFLAAITYPQGGKTDVVYKAASLYMDGLNLLNPNLPFAIDTVEKIITSDGAGLSSTAIYSYEGGKYYYANAFDRKFSGFAKVTETDAVGNISKTYYHQGDATNSVQGEFSDHASKIGSPYRTEAYNSAGNLYSKSISKWENYDLGLSRNFVKLTQKIDSSYDGNATHRDKAETSTYDNTNGNLTGKTQWGEVTGADNGTFVDIGTDKLDTAISYASNLATNVIGLPSQETILDQSGIKIKESKYYYDALALGSADKGNQTKEEKWKSGVEYINAQKAYNSYGLVTQETDPRGKITSYTYDAYNLYPATITNALSQVTQYVYDYSSGKPKQVTDPNGFIFQTVFDGLDRVVEEKQPDLTIPTTLVTKSSYVYIDTANAVSVKKTDYLDTTTNVDSYSYFDGLGRIIQTRQEAEDANNFSGKDLVYNNRGLLDKESLPYFSTGTAKTSVTADATLYSTYAYDALGRVTSTINAVGTTTNAYDDWKVTTTDAKGVAKDLYKDAYDRLIQVGEHNGVEVYTTAYTYDGAGDLTKITDALGNIRNFTYDALGQRLTAEDLHAPSDATFGVWTYIYDASGNLISQTDPKTQIVNYTYDDLNRQLTEDYTGQAGTEKTYGYDTCLNGVGKLCSITTSDYTETKEYNALGAASKETKTISAVNYITQYAYDRQGNNILLTNPDNSQVKYLYNSAGQLEQTQRKETTDAIFINLVTDFDYSPLGKITYQASVNGTATTNTYDAAKLYRLISKVTTITGGSHAQDLVYTYDANGNITRIVDSSNTNSAKTVDYTYDSLNRLLTAIATGAANGQNYAEIYFYDAIGNITSKNGVAYTYSSTGKANPHAVTSIGATSYTYDDNGNLLSDGNMVNTWNYQNQLTQTSIPSGQGASAPVTQTFAPVKGDGSVYATNSSWAKAQSAISGNSVNYTNGTSNVRVGKSNSTTFLIERAFLPFDTSSLPDNAAITDAKLKVYVSAKANNDNDGTDWVTVDRGTETYTISLAKTDYDNVGGVTNPTEGIDSTQRKDITDVKTGQYSEFILNTTGKSWISPTGPTKLALREGHDATNSAFVGASSQYNSLIVRTGEYTGTTNDPILEVTYTLPVPATVINYAYDASGQRIKYSNGTATTIYPSKFYNTDGTALTKHIFAGSALIGTISGTGASAVAHTVATDHLTGANVVTSSAGVVEELADYYPYGEVRLDEKVGSFSEQRKFAGHELDVDTGLSYMNARYYSGKMGRFASIDPLAMKNPEKVLEDPQSLNSYAYARNNPLANIDPDGKSAKTFLYGVGVGALWAASAVFIVAASPVVIPASILTGAAVAGLGLVGYGTYENYQAHESGKISDDLFHYNAGNLLGGLAAPAKFGEFGGVKEPVGVKGNALVESKPYTNSRPSYGKGQINAVWENAKNIDGNVFDRNTGEQLFWDKSMPRNGQWDMGHKPDSQYKDLHNNYMSGNISKGEFLQEYRNPDNYQPQSVWSNRSGVFDK